MAKIKINNQREISLLPEKKNPDNKHIKIGNEYVELTTDKGLTNGAPYLVFTDTKDSTKYYPREKFEDSP